MRGETRARVGRVEKEGDCQENCGELKLGGWVGGWDAKGVEGWGVGSNVA